MEVVLSACITATVPLVEVVLSACITGTVPNVEVFFSVLNNKKRKENITLHHIGTILLLKETPM